MIELMLNFDTLKQCCAVADPKSKVRSHMCHWQLVMHRAACGLPILSLNLMTNHGNDSEPITVFLHCPYA